MTHLTITTITTGDSKKFRATVTDYDEQTLRNADGSVTFSVYDNDTNYLIHTGTATNPSTGVYEYVYTFPDYPATFYIEFKGVWNTNNQLERQKVRTKKVV